jgi:3-methyladenine DNA glycosylase AlkD
MNLHHRQLLDDILSGSGTPTQHTFSDAYLGNTNPRYAINAPSLRTIAKAWSLAHKALSTKEFLQVMDSLIKGKSSTEKVLAGILLDYATADQKNFAPKIFDQWLDHLAGWAEVDAGCTGHYTIKTIPENETTWSVLLRKFARSKNINKRRASLVFLCSPTRHHQAPWMAELAIANIELLKSEKEVLITKAISWLLRSMVKHYRKTVDRYLREQGETLPAIAVRETNRKLVTGRK